MSIYDDCTLEQLEAMRARVQQEANRYVDRRLARRSAWGRDRDGGDEMYALTMREISEAIQRKRVNTGP